MALHQSSCSADLLGDYNLSQLSPRGFEPTVNDTHEVFRDERRR